MPVPRTDWDGQWFAKNTKQRKHLIKELGTDPLPEDTEFTMADRLGYLRVYDCGKKINFYKIDPNDDGIQKMTLVIRESVLAVNSAVKELRNLKNTQKIVECVIQINNSESQGDDIFDVSIDRLFESENDIKMLIKKRELFQSLEIVTDKCEDAGNVIESIVVKYA
jgi:uncharacterized protein Yka (UPF0111/DUF47 family)